MKQYPWSTNPQKLARAIGVAGKDATEEEIKAEYMKIGGKVALSGEEVYEEKDTIEIETEEAEPVVTTPEVGGTVDTFNQASEESAPTPEVSSEVTASNDDVEMSSVSSTDDTSI